MTVGGFSTGHLGLGWVVSHTWSGEDDRGLMLEIVGIELGAKEVIERVVGRPSLTGVSQTSPLVRARVPESLKAKLEKEAKRRGETPSELIREALESYLSA